MNLFLLSCAAIAAASVCFGMLLLRREKANAPEGFEDNQGFHVSFPTSHPAADTTSWAA